MFWRCKCRANSFLWWLYQKKLYILYKLGTTLQSNSFLSVRTGVSHRSIKKNFFLRTCASEYQNIFTTGWIFILTSFGTFHLILNTINSPPLAASELSSRTTSSSYEFLHTDVVEGNAFYEFLPSTMVWRGS